MNVYSWTKAWEGTRCTLAGVSSDSCFLLSTARKSSHTFANKEEEDSSLIYNYSPTYTGEVSNFEQVYIFWFLAPFLSLSLMSATINSP